MDERKPLQSKSVKVIDQKGTLYATIDGSRYWQLEDYVYKVLKMCNGQKTVDEIAKQIAGPFYPVDRVLTELQQILQELERNGLISFH